MTRVAFVALLLLGAAAPAASQAPAQLTVELFSFGYSPRPIRLAAGKPVTLAFVNRSGSGHDFTAPGFFQHATITAGAAPRGEIDLKPRETRTITLIPQKGTYKAHCGRFLHKQMGMTDLVVVD